MKKELWRAIYMGSDRVYLHAARIIGYRGCSPCEFYDAAKLLPNYDQRKFERAMEDLTIWKARQPPTLRYEFTAEARKVVKALLGPPPESPEFSEYWSREVFQPGMSEPTSPARSRRSRRRSLAPGRRRDRASPSA
jgi:hypothetical protein